MNQDDQPSLENVILRFETAERSLVLLRDQLPQLLDATSKFVAADLEMRSRTTTAVNALEEIRARLREQIVSSDEVAKTTIDVYRSFTEVVDEFRQILLLLGSIDPAAMTKD
ncbi:MAG: hypothetical protein WC864_04395, partial [Ilumatobacteraceae bacterium]